jgi:hypothetical protein
MRSIKEIYEKREEGLFPCQYPRCRGYGNTSDRKHGVICKEHAVLPVTIGEGRPQECVTR